MSKYVEVMAGSGVAEAMAKAGEVAPTTEHPPLIGSFEDSKDGAALPGLAVLGEYEAPAEVKAEKTAKAKARRKRLQPMPYRHNRRGWPSLADICLSEPAPDVGAGFLHSCILRMG